MGQFRFFKRDITEPACRRDEQDLSPPD